MQMLLVELLGSHIVVGLTDKAVERRVYSGRELGFIASSRSKNLDDRNMNLWLEECIGLIGSELLCSPYAHYRMGGLLACSSLVSACAEKVSESLLNDIVGSLGKLVNDDEGRVRYFACDAVCSVTRIVRSRVLESFAIVFDCVCKLSGDGESENRQCATALDRMLKEVVTEQYKNNPTNEYGIVHAVGERMSYPNVYAKQVCLGWVLLLESIPNADILPFLALFLPPLISMVSLNASRAPRDNSVQAESILKKLLGKVERESVAITAEIIDEIFSVLLKHCVPRDALLVLPWLEVLGPKSRNPVDCADLVLALLKLLHACTSSKPQIFERILSSHKIFFSSEAFRNMIDVPRLLWGLRIMLVSPSSEHKAYITAVIEWTTLADQLEESDIEVFFKLQLTAEVLKVVLTRFPMNLAARKLIEYKGETDKWLHVLGDSIAPEKQREFVEAILTESFHSGDDKSQFSFQIITLALSDDRFQKFRQEILTQDDLVGKAGKVCTVGAIALALFTGKAHEAFVLSESLTPHDEDEITTFAVRVFEAKTFANVRKQLGGSENAKDICRCLLNLCAVIGQNSRGFTCLFNRLQLANVFLNNT